jgi:hypothetical protein
MAYTLKTTYAGGYSASRASAIATNQFNSTNPRVAMATTGQYSVWPYDTVLGAYFKDWAFGGAYRACLDPTNEDMWLVTDPIAYPGDPYYPWVQGFERFYLSIFHLHTIRDNGSDTYFLSRTGIERTKQASGRAVFPVDIARTPDGHMAVLCMFPVASGLGLLSPVMLLKYFDPELRQLWEVTLPAQTDSSRERAIDIAMDGDVPVIYVLSGYPNGVAGGNGVFPYLTTYRASNGTVIQRQAFADQTVLGYEFAIASAIDRLFVLGFTNYVSETNVREVLLSDITQERDRIVFSEATPIPSIAATSLWDVYLTRYSYDGVQYAGAQRYVKAGAPPPPPPPPSETGFDTADFSLFYDDKANRLYGLSIINGGVWLYSSTGNAVGWDGPPVQVSPDGITDCKAPHGAVLGSGKLRVGYERVSQPGTLSYRFSPHSGAAGTWSD